MPETIRFLFSVKFTLATPAKLDSSTGEATNTGEIWELVAVLDRQGRSRTCQAAFPKRRVIDLRQGDQVCFAGKTHTIMDIRAFRDARGPRPLCQEISVGYVVRNPSR